MMGIRQTLADPLQPPECVLGDIAGVDDPHHIAVIQDRRFLDMMIGKHVADGSQIVRQVYRDDGFAGDVPDFAVHQLLQFFVKIHGHKGRRIDVEGMLGGEKPKNISVGDKSDQRLVAIDHGNAADAFFRQQIQHGGQAGVTADCVDVLFHKLRQGRVYGIELTGDTPRSDLTEMAIPSVMMRNPVTYTRNRMKILVSFVSCFIFMPLYFRFFIDLIDAKPFISPHKCL